MIFELHFGSVYVSMYVCIYLSPGKFKFFESAGISSLALVNKIEKFSYLLLQHTLPEKLFLLDRSISKECRNFVFRSRE